MSERIQRMLARCNAKTGSYKVMSAGGKREIVPADALAAMSGADKLGSLLAARLWMLDTSADAQIERLAYLRAIELAVSGKWRIPKGREYVRRMTRLAIRELTDPERCPACQGSCQQWNADKLEAQPCSHCGGTGRVRMNDSKRAAAVEMDPSRWSRVWRTRYESIHAAIDNAVTEAINHAAKRLG